MFENEKGGFGCPNDDCRAMIEKFLTICLPVTVKPKVKVGKIKAECCGNPIVSGDRHEKCCKDMQKDSCHFTIIQKMKDKVQKFAKALGESFKAGVETFKGYYNTPLEPTPARSR